MMQIEMKCEDARLVPLRAHPTDAGADLRSNKDFRIEPGQTSFIDTGISIKVPVKHVGFIYARSSMGKVRVTIANGTGVIDPDYRGNLMVRLVNEGYDDFIIKAFDTRIAQLVVVPCETPVFIKAKSDWLDTTRGLGGFGSTGT